MVAGPVRGIAGPHILVEVVEVLLHRHFVVADRTRCVEDTAVAVDSTAVAGKVGRMAVVVKVRVYMAMRRRTDSTAEGHYTCWSQDVTGVVVVAMTWDTVLVQDSGPPGRAEKIYSWSR